MSADRINYLIRKYAMGGASGEELEELFEWLKQNDNDEELRSQLEIMASTATPRADYNPEEWEPFIQQVLQMPVIVKSNQRRAWWKYAAAAAIVAGIASLVILLIINNKDQQPAIAAVKEKSIPTEVHPGRNGAVLTLGDGSAVLLDSAGNGLLATQGQTAVVVKNGRLVYDVTAKNKEVFMNTMSTPKGRTYELTLPDGSMVWLNAASSITYPTEFMGDLRNVSITGEAYFEIAQNKSKPFHVKVNDMNVEVLGTDFNINSYSDERSVKTTLLDGKVRISKNGKQNILKPGQQAIAEQNSISIIDDVDTDQVMAWKKGLFNFDRMSLPSILNQIARWYDVEVKYEGAVSARTFRGKVSRDQNLDLVLEVLRDVGVKFKMEGKTLTVIN